MPRRRPRTVGEQPAEPPLGAPPPGVPPQNIPQHQTGQRQPITEQSTTSPSNLPLQHQEANSPAGARHPPSEPPLHRCWTTSVCRLQHSDYCSNQPDVCPPPLVRSASKTEILQSKSPPSTSDFERLEAEIWQPTKELTDADELE
ncbi:SNF2 domain-containing protein [Striga asiatica]|uniref:SNF2 domain-containing protein n=1 Tax=Striga asiatica TaxID=4170 RepID=A0A5A7PHM1_STRAF|nr:SNF2 domain-containing protein [Striga asiatica]